MTAIAEALRTALLDFVWQGLLAAFLLWIALIVLRNQSARARYAASTVALALMTVLPVVTACLVYSAPAAFESFPGWLAAQPQALRAVPHRAASIDWGGWLSRGVLPVWSLGVLLFSLRLIWASRQISILRRQAKTADACVLAIVGRLQERMQLTRPVRVAISALADCPSVVGWIRPAVLLPAATILGLTPQQLEGVLAHELAHILRYDPLANILQTAVETVLFYHPAVWWVSARMRHERELCCDDLAVEACGDALCYARALSRLERLRVSPKRLAVGSTGGPLLYRIRRVVGETGRQPGPSKLPGILALSLGLICFALNLQWARGQQPQAPVAEPATLDSSVPDDPGVQVDLGGARVIHRDAVEYPPAAIEKGVQGTVVVEATLDADGMVGDARVLSGPLELRKAALESVLEWHFSRDAAGSPRQLGISFRLPADSDATELSAKLRSRRAEEQALARAKRQRDKVDAQVRMQLAERMAEQAGLLESRDLSDASQLEEAARSLAGLVDQARSQQDMASSNLAGSLAGQRRQSIAEVEALELQAEALRKSLGALAGASALSAARADQAAVLEKRLLELQQESGAWQGAAMFAGHRLKSIHIEGLTRPLRDELLSTLPVHVGDTLAADSMERIQAAVKKLDEHLGLSMQLSGDGQVEIHITAPGSGEGR